MGGGCAPHAFRPEAVLRVVAFVSRDEKRRGVVRFSVSLPGELAERLDAMVDDRGLPSRSLAVAEMIRQQLARHWLARGDATLAGTITVVYRGSDTNARAQLLQVQRRYLPETITSQHAFLEDDHCLEVLLVQGPGDRLRALCDELLACRGVEQAELTATGALLPPLRGEADGAAGGEDEEGSET